MWVVTSLLSTQSIETNKPLFIHLQSEGIEETSVGFTLVQNSRIALKQVGIFSCEDGWDETGVNESLLRNSYDCLTAGR